MTLLFTHLVCAIWAHSLVCLHFTKLLICHILGVGISESGSYNREIQTQLRFLYYAAPTYYPIFYCLEVIVPTDEQRTTSTNRFR